MRVQRYEDWPSRLYHYLKKHESIEFEYGKFDCCLFVARWLTECTGETVTEFDDFNYHSSESALLFLKRRKLNTPIDAVKLVIQRINAPEIPPFMAKRGDVVIVEAQTYEDINNNLVAGICTGRDVAVLSFTGIIYVPITSIKSAWEI